MDKKLFEIKPSKVLLPDPLGPVIIVCLFFSIFKFKFSKIFKSALKYLNESSSMLIVYFAFYQFDNNFHQPQFYFF